MSVENHKRRNVEIDYSKKVVLGLLIVAFIIFWTIANYRASMKIHQQLLTTGGEIDADNIQEISASKFSSVGGKPKIVIDEWMLDKQIGTVKRSAREYFEFRDQYDDSSPQCKATYYGLEWLRFLNDSAVEVCQPKYKEINDEINTQSKIKCSFVHDRFPESYCLAENIAIDISLTSQFYTNMLLNGTSSNDQRNKFPASGSIKANCEIKSPLWQTEYFWGGSQKWLVETLQANQKYENEDECIAWVEHPVFVYGEMIENQILFYGLNLAAEQFLAYSLFDIGLDAQIIVADQIHDQDIESYFGVAYQMLMQMFSPKRPPRTLYSIIQESVMRSGGKNSGSVCFRKMMFNTMAHRSFLAKDNRIKTECRNSASVNSLVHFLTDGMGITQSLPPSHLFLSPISRVVWISRRGFSHNIENEEEVVSFLKKEVAKLGHQFLNVELHKMPIVEQMRFVRSTDVLVGVHGVGLTLGFVLPQSSALIEIETKGQGEAYRNFGIWRNLFYVKYFHDTLRPDPDSISSVVLIVINLVRKRTTFRLLPDGTLGPQDRSIPCGADYYENTSNFFIRNCSEM
eukprot:TRINITY_DN2571_c0_g1_i1.p1 TRINITY_DN2571_c0_g1~~TRINITY_DN2571_c0_g1_i1.p1  ORF type:complete len:571 (+),score=74.91 TRINITY_DN2571_c0_g1_i1:151-1863(+)